MQKIIKRLLQIIFALIVIAGLGYVGYQAYLYIIDDATKRIKKEISGTMNPLMWPGKILGGGKKRE